jgi:hypothetical protein
LREEIRNLIANIGPIVQQQHVCHGVILVRTLRDHHGDGLCAQLHIEHQREADIGHVPNHKLAVGAVKPVWSKNQSAPIPEETTAFLLPRTQLQTKLTDKKSGN